MAKQFGWSVDRLVGCSVGSFRGNHFDLHTHEFRMSHFDDSTIPTPTHWLTGQAINISTKLRWTCGNFSGSNNNNEHCNSMPQKSFAAPQRLTAHFAQTLRTKSSNLVICGNSLHCRWASAELLTFKWNRTVVWLLHTAVYFLNPRMCSRCKNAIAIEFV